MLPDGRRLGAHLPLADGMVKAVERARAIGASAIQIFSDNPTAWRRRALPPVELTAFRDRLRAYDIDPVAIHASYLVNLAGAEPSFFERSIELLAHELHDAPSFGSRFVNVHIGSHRGSGIARGIHQVAEGVARSLATADILTALAGQAGEDAVRKSGNNRAAGEFGGGAGGAAVVIPSAIAPAMLVLENSAGSGAGLGVDLDELTAIADAIADAGIPSERVGFCLDTAHAWGAGIDVASPTAMDAFLAEFDARIGRDRLVMVHLNDSRFERGSRMDRHEHLAAGRIGPDGLAHVLRHPLLAHAAYLLETPGMDAGYDAINLARAHDLAAGRPLAPLPPGAMEVHSSRARTAPA
ncbi:MAG: TIM barrel protein [Chloroflexi bacterium]|nr:TIM barrel protein [Chloroflexota bacterium]